MFEAFEEHLPPAGTPITILLKPILPGKPAGKQAAAANPRHAEAEQKAIESAEPWLALVDRGAILAKLGNGRRLPQKRR